MNQGFILLHRKIRDNWIYKRPDYYHWFTEFIFMANFKDNNNYLFEGEFIKIKRGDFVTSYRQLAKKLPNCSEQKIRTFIKLLIKDKIVLIKSLKKATQITILNYDSYQGEQHNSNTVATQQQHSSNTVATTIERKKKKDNNENKISDEIKNFTASLSKLFPENIITKLTDSQKRNWIDTIDKLIRIDKFTKQQIEKAIKAGRKDEFWSKQFLSMNKLRKLNKDDIKYINVFLNLNGHQQTTPQLKEIIIKHGMDG